VLAGLWHFMAGMWRFVRPVRFVAILWQGCGVLWQSCGRIYGTLMAGLWHPWLPVGLDIVAMTMKSLKLSRRMPYSNRKARVEGFRMDKKGRIQRPGESSQPAAQSLKASP